MYSENGCLQCREAEASLRLLLGNEAFDAHFRVLKMTFDLALQADFKARTGSPKIPKLYQGDYRTGRAVALDFAAIMDWLAAGEAHRAVGQTAPRAPAEERADALVLGGGPGGVLAYARLVERGYRPLILSESVGGRLVTARHLAHAEAVDGLEVFRRLAAGAPGWLNRLRAGIRVDGVQLDGARKVLTAGGRRYTTDGPLVLATGVVVQHFELQSELDFLERGVIYHDLWVDARDSRVTVYASRGRLDGALAAVRRLSERGNDVVLVSPDPLPAETSAATTIRGRVTEVVTAGDPPRVVGARTKDRVWDTDWIVWHTPFRSRGQPVIFQLAGTDWLHVDSGCRVVNADGAVLPGVYGVGDALMDATFTLAGVRRSVDALALPQAP